MSSPLTAQRPSPLRAAGAFALVLGLLLVLLPITATAALAAPATIVSQTGQVTGNCAPSTGWAPEDATAPYGNDFQDNSWGTFTAAGGDLSASATIRAGWSVELCVKAGPSYWAYTLACPGTSDCDPTPLAGSAQNEISHLAYRSARQWATGTITCALTTDPGITEPYTITYTITPGGSTGPFVVEAATGGQTVVTPPGGSFGVTRRAVYSLYDNSVPSNLRAQFRKLGSNTCPALPPSTQVTPVAPTVVQSQECDVQGTLTIATTAGVDYFVNGVPTADGTVVDGPGAFTVTAEAQAGFTLTAPFDETYVLAVADPCDDEVTPVAPTVVQSQECDVQGTLTIATTAGVDYFVNGVPTADGTVVDGPGAFTVTAQAQAGFTLTAPFDETYVLAVAEECEGEPVEPTATIAGECNDLTGNGIITADISNPDADSTDYVLTATPVGGGTPIVASITSAETTLRLELPGLADNTYSVTVTADGEIIASDQAVVIACDEEPELPTATIEYCQGELGDIVVTIDNPSGDEFDYELLVDGTVVATSTSLDSMVTLTDFVPGNDTYDIEVRADGTTILSLDEVVVNCDGEPTPPTGEITGDCDGGEGFIFASMSNPDGATVTYRIDVDGTTTNTLTTDATNPTIGTNQSWTDGTYLVELFADDVLIDSEDVPIDCDDDTTPPTPPPPTTPPPTPVPGTVDVAADNICRTGSPVLDLFVDFTDNDAPVAQVTVTLQDGTTVLDSYTFTGDASELDIAWPDLDLSTIDLVVDGVVQQTLTQPDDCSDVLGEEVTNPDPDPTPDPTDDPTDDPTEDDDTEVLDETVVNPAPDTDDEELAATGLDSAHGMALGSLLLGLGMVLLSIDRRRQTI